ncbi:MAG: zinc-binding dehydrogenase [Rubricoccaceae bacterium]
MKQVWITRAGGPEVLAVRDAPDPAPGPGQVRLRVEAAGINFADVLARQGIYPDAPPLPAVVGYEVAGVVDAVGAGVDDLPEGTPVLALTRFGGYSSAVVVHRRQVFRRPEGMSAEEGAALPVTYLTAFQAMVAMGSVRRAEELGRRTTVLVHAAAGGVGSAAADLGAYYGARMIGTASPAKHAFARSRGYEALIDYTAGNWAEEVRALTGGRGADLILDPIGGRHWRHSLRALRRGGRLVVFGIAEAAGRGKLGLARMAAGVPWLKMTPFALMNANKGVLGVNLGHLWRDGDEVGRWAERLLALYREGHIRPHVDRTYPFERAGEAHAHIESRQSVGKVLLTP